MLYSEESDLRRDIVNCFVWITSLQAVALVSSFKISSYFFVGSVVFCLAMGSKQAVQSSSFKHSDMFWII